MKTNLDHMKSLPKYSKVDVADCQEFLRDQKSVLLEDSTGSEIKSTQSYKEATTVSANGMEKHLSFHMKRHKVQEDTTAGIPETEKVEKQHKLNVKLKRSKIKFIPIQAMKPECGRDSLLVQEVIEIDSLCIMFQVLSHYIASNKL